MSCKINVPYSTNKWCTMILYRAMCKLEYDNSNNRLDFTNRFKWFSPNIDFIQKRVKDGKFNNSKLVDGRYEIICKFNIESGMEHFVRLNHNEYMLDRRKSNNVKITSIETII
jgi:hypothetical protein